jgi:DNA-directed RNA polymerase
VRFRERTLETPVHIQKQYIAFPANFVHSLDATHMIMSAIACKEHGIDFAVAHDSFWTHACAIDTMNKVLLEQFVKLHRQPLMENLLNEFIKRYKDHMIPASILKRVNPEETELFISGSAISVNSLDLVDETEELFDDVVNDPEPDDVPLEGTMIHTEDLELKPVEKMGELGKEHWVPIEFPPLPPRSESDITKVRKNRCFFY